jgi:hypothetical protein
MHTLLNQAKLDAYFKLLFKHIKVQITNHRKAIFTCLESLYFD